VLTEKNRAEASGFTRIKRDEDNMYITAFLIDIPTGLNELNFKLQDNSVQFMFLDQILYFNPPVTFSVNLTPFNV